MFSASGPGSESECVHTLTVHSDMDKRTTPSNVVNPRPTTPQRVLDASASGKLLSTPSNRGSASTSEYLTGAR